MKNLKIITTLIIILSYATLAIALLGANPPLNALGSLSFVFAFTIMTLGTISGLNTLFNRIIEETKREFYHKGLRKTVDLLANEFDLAGYETLIIDKKGETIGKSNLYGDSLDLIRGIINEEKVLDKL